MNRLNSFREVLEALGSGEILTTNFRCQFIYKKKKVFYYSEGNSFSLSLEDFRDLYGNETFYLYEDTDDIDESKDEAYYRYYRK